ncbi:hypothetical protein HJG60_010829 [Phyllostomus discolor]|uniref:Uncharacterized protein n=1 Tax=Phyllostomus discolor TaxID=89673 RepID=A0A834AH23_9CHIR|nr:hypothetical protein HJG60_010829 [Phyllostomus discolor]
MSSASLGENIDPNTSQYEHELEQKNLEVKILRGRNAAMKHKLFKLRKATQCLNAAAGLEPAMPLSILLSDNINHNAPEYKNQLEQQNLEMKTLRRRNVAMKQKLLKLQKATECLNAAAGLLPAMSSVSQGENIDPNASEYEHELQQKNLEMKIQRGRNIAMKHKLLKLRKATECLNVAAGLLPAMSSASLGENIDPNASEYEQLEQQNLEMKILRGRNIAMKYKLLKVRKATECLNVAAGLVPAMSSTSLGENVDPNTSQYEHGLEQENLEVKILRGRNVALKHKLLKLQKATQCLNAAAGLIPTMPASNSLGDNIDHNASEYKNQLEQQNLEMRILRGRNEAMKNKLLKLQKATQYLNAAAGLLPAMSSASLSESIVPNAAEYEHELEQENLEVKILRGRNVAMKNKLLKVQKATQCLNAAFDLLPATSSASLGKNIDPSAFQYEHALEQKNLEVKILRGRNVAMRHKLLKLQKATQCLNPAASLEPTMPLSTLLGDNIDHNAPEYKNQLKQQNLEMKILRGRNVAMKHKLLKLQKAIHCLSAAVGLLPATALASLGENIHLNASEHKHELQEKTLEMKILKERLEAMKCKLLKLHNANQSINVAADLIPAMPASISLGDNIDPNASEYEHQLELKSINHHASSTYQNLKNRMTRWIWSKVSPAYSEINAACHV